MKRHLNTLFVSTQGAYVAKDGENLLIRVEGTIKLRAPVHLLAGIVCFGRVGLSASVLGLCGERGVPVSLLSRSGRFRARVVGGTRGNVLLRREQYRRADDPQASLDLARSVLTGKLLNSRTSLVRSLRENMSENDQPAVQTALNRLGELARGLVSAKDLDSIRGLEGEAARTYFSVFDRLIRPQDETLRFKGRNRRPPRDPVNALLSFVYTLLHHDVRSATEAAGLDPYVGFLHRDRPGRAGLALDLVESFRSFFADRLVLKLLNKHMVTAAGFTTSESGAVTMDDATRETVLRAYQKRKQETLRHPFLDEETTVGHLWFLEALLLARHLRGDLDAFPPFLWR